MNKTRLRLLLADDHLVVRVGLRSLLEAERDLTVVGEAAGGRAAIEAFMRHHPDVTLMDLRMPDLSGVEATAAIRQRYPAARVLVLSTFDSDENIYRALEAGAAGYLLKNISGSILIDTIRAVHAGTYRMPESIAARMAQRRAAPELSGRELEVLLLIVKGQCNKEIAATLGLAENTVKNHVKVILDKLGAADRTQAATTALQRGIVEL